MAKRGGQWNATTVRAVLANPVYTGRVRHRGEIFDGEHEQLIEDDAHERVQVIAARRSSTRSRSGGGTPEGSHLFTRGLLRCGLCEGPMLAVTKPTRTGSTYEAYACDTRRRNGTDACEQTPVRRHELDAAALAEFERRHLDLEKTRQRLDGELSGALDTAAELAIEADAAVARAEAATARLDRDYLDGRIGAEDFNRMIARATEELAAVRAQAERAHEHEARLRELPESIDAEAEALRALTRLRELIVSGIGARDDLLALREAIGLVFDRVVYRAEGSRWATVEMGGGAWLEPWLREEIVQDYDDECRPILERVPLLLRRDTTACPHVWLSQLAFPPISIAQQATGGRA